MSSPENNQAGLDQASHQVDEIAGIMKSNIDKVLEREGKLHELDKSACLLEIEATKFESNATKVKKTFWWQNMKRNLYIAGGIVALVILIIILIILGAMGII